jgi:hypothetical protein
MQSVTTRYQHVEIKVEWHRLVEIKVEWHRLRAALVGYHIEAALRW